MVRKDKKYHKLDLEQSRLKSNLHEKIREYYKWKQGKPKDDDVKAPITMAELRKQEAEINRIRRRIEKQPIRHIRDLKKTLKHL